MGPPLYMQSILDQNIIRQCMAVDSSEKWVTGQTTAPGTGETENCNLPEQKPLQESDENLNCDGRAAGGSAWTSLC